MGLNIWGHIETVPSCSTGTSTNVVLHRNAMPQIQDMTPTPSQCTDTGHDTHPVTVYRHRTWHPPRHSVQIQDMTPTPSQCTDTGHETHPVTVYRHRTWHPPRYSVQIQDMTPTPSRCTDTGHDTQPATLYRHRTDLCYPMMMLWW